jgi:DNA-binding NarL/FixJ family response regulator
MSQTIRLLVADDHPIVREGLIAILATQPDFSVIGEASNGQELLDLARTLQPDVLLTDLDMPTLDGVSAIRQMQQHSPRTRMIVLTAYASDELIIGALQAGVHGYLLKGVPRQEIFSAIRAVAAGGTLLQPLVAARLLQRISEPPGEALTPREHEVLARLKQGHMNKEIALALGISERTVKFHVSALLAKLGAGNRTEAVARAVERGLIER